MATSSGQGIAPRNIKYFQDLDDLLRCGICFDYLNIAMIIPQCSHNYCSLCIRKFMSYKTQCPTCCVTVTEPDLRNNRILDDLVKTFVSARQHLPQFVFDSPPMSPQNTTSLTRSMGCGKKQAKDNAVMDSFLVSKNPPFSKSSSKHHKKETVDSKLDIPASCTTTLKEEPDDDIPIPTESLAPGAPSTSSARVKVGCPVCSVDIPEQFINKHLDSCLTREEKKESLRSSVQKRKSMTKVVYNLLSERDLKKRLKEVGLSTHGSKPQMIRRHQEFVHMFNAQCDSLNPKSAAEIVREVQNNEKIRTELEAKNEERGMTFTKGQSEQEIDMIHEEYRKKHKSEFQQLIDQMKSRKRKSGRKIKEEPEDGPSNTEDTHHKQEAGICEQPAIKCELQQRDSSERLLYTKSPSAVRSSSPVFPLSPQSTASSSSDILRDMDEAENQDQSKSGLSQSEPRLRKRKLSPQKTSNLKGTSRGKRRRK